MRRGFFLFIAALSIATDPGVASAVDLQPHRAVYRMVLDKARRNSDVVSANGVMVYRFARVCDGWTVENRTFLRLLYDNDTEADTLWSFASWEAKDGLSFRFHTRYEQDGKIIEKLDGSASLHGRGGAGTARLATPETRIALPAGTLFPTEHLREVVAAAESGRHAFGRVVFDGASLENPYLVNALFGPLSSGTAEAMASALKLPVRPAWWMRMAFFSMGAIEAEPEFEMSAQYRSDGIADHILQQFDAFSLDVRIKEVELLPPPDC